MAQSRQFKYPNLTILFLSLIVAYILYRSGALHSVVSKLGSFELVGLFVTGMFFVSTFTIAPAVAVLLAFVQDYNPLVVAIVGGFGAAFGDYLAMIYVRDKLLDELNPLLKALHIYRKINILHSKYFAWLAPALGAAIVASPLPDELGLVLLGASKLGKARLIMLVFLLNAAGILLIALAARA